MKTNYAKELLYRLNVNSNYDLQLLKDAFYEILNIEENNTRNIMLGSILTAVMTKEPSVDEVVTLLNTSFSIDGYDPMKREKIVMPNNEKVITIVGSGKKGIKTINISTASAILAASMGAFVVKPGSCSTSSITGSADFMELVGANKNLSLDDSKVILKQCGFAFFKIEDVIPKFDKIYGGNFYVPHVLSFGLAALVCPIETDILLYGLAHPNVELSLNVLKEYGIKQAMVISSTDDDIHFIDEMGIFGNTRLIGTQDGKNNGELLIFNPLQELNLPKYSSSDIKQGNNKIENVKYILEVLNGTGRKSHEDIICINCSNILYLSGIVKDLNEGYILSKEAVKTGQGLKKLIEYVELTGGNKNNILSILEDEYETNNI